MAGSEPFVIVGGGIVGTSIAYHLRDAGRPVVLLERDDLLGSGTTSESIAMLGLTYPSPIPMRRYSRDHYASLIDDGTIGFEQIGTLKVRSRTESGTAELERIAADLDALGHETSYLAPEEVAEFGVHPPEDTRTLHVPDEGYLDPSEIIAYWTGQAEASGVEIRTGTAVTGIRATDGAVTAVETPEETLGAAAVVNAAGPWSPRINDLAGVSLPLRHNHGPILVLDVGEELSLPNTSFPNGHYFREESRTRVFAGRKGRGYEETEQMDPDHARSVPESFALDAHRLIESSVPALSDARVVNEWLGMRTITPDGLPIVGETDVADLYVASGASGKGITLAPAIGRGLAARLVDEDPPFEVQALSPDRFPAA